MLSYTMDPNANEQDHEDAEFIDELNDLVESGLIRMEIGEDGEPKLFPAE